MRFGVRDYDPASGRWTAKDPIGLEGGFNVYAYAANDPVNLVDRVGRSAAPVLAEVVEVTAEMVVGSFELVGTNSAAAAAGGIGAGGAAVLTVTFGAALIVGTIANYYLEDSIQEFLDELFNKDAANDDAECVDKPKLPKPKGRCIFDFAQSTRDAANCWYTCASDGKKIPLDRELAQAIYGPYLNNTGCPDHIADYR